MRQSLIAVCLPSLLAVCTAFAALPVHAAYVQPKIQHENYGTVRVVVPVTSADAKVWAFKLHNIANGIDGAKAAGGEMLAEVVLYGPGLKMLVQPDTALTATIDELRQAGVRFKICNNTLKGMDLDWHELYKVQESDIVPSGFLEVGWRANQGWAVDAMN